MLSFVMLSWVANFLEVEKYLIFVLQYKVPFFFFFVTSDVLDFVALKRLVSKEATLDLMY